MVITEGVTTLNNQSVGLSPHLRHAFQFDRFPDIFSVCLRDLFRVAEAVMEECVSIGSVLLVLRVMATCLSSVADVCDHSDISFSSIG